MGYWHPEARRVVYSDIGVFMNVPRRIVWHTIEGNHLPAYSNSHPHFTLDPRTGNLWQHSPINRGVKTLKNLAGGVDTNRVGAIQIELFGFARETPAWPDRWYAECADLARWIERNGPVKRVCSVDFTTSAHSMGAAKWMSYEGHCGHQNVPEQDHWDPGRFRIDKVLDLSDDVHRAFNGGESGLDVAAFQRATNRIAVNNCRPDHKITVDGDYGERTLKHGAWALWMRGVGDTAASIQEGGIGVKEQTWARDYGELSAKQKSRGRDRRRRHSRCDD